MYFIVTLDQKQLWKTHVGNILSGNFENLQVYSRKNVGMQLYCIYIAIVRPVITYEVAIRKLENSKTSNSVQQLGS